MKELDFFSRYVRDYQYYKGGSWCYEDGLIYRALVLLHQVTNETKWLDNLIRLTDGQIAPDGSLAGYRQDEFNIDNVLAGRCLFYLADVTGDAKYMAAAAILDAQLRHHPRTSTGNYWHKKIYPQQVWLDGLYMGLPFQVEFALRSGEHNRISDVLAQFRSALLLTATDKGLFVHGYDEARDQQWADKKTGQSAAVWARAVGWLAMAMVDVCDLLQGRDEAGPLRHDTATLLEAVQKEQRASGLWQQVLGQDVDGNFDESSASAMMAYAMICASRLGLVGDDIAEAGRKAHRALTDTKLLPDEDGVLHLVQMCHVAGLGGFGERYRDGSPDYYMTEDIVSDDTKGVGPFMMTVAEIIRQENRQDKSLSATEKKAG